MKRVRLSEVLPLHPESCRGLAEDVSAMQRLLEHDPESIHRLQTTSYFENGDEIEVTTYPLHEACQQIHVNCVKFLIKSGAQVDFQSVDANNSLHYTIFGHNYEKHDPRVYQIVEELLKNKTKNSNIYKIESKFQTDLIELIKLNLNYIIKLFLEYNEFYDNMLPENDFPKFYNTSFSPVTFALLKRNFECVKLLLLHGDRFNNYTRHANQFFGLPTSILKQFKDYEDALRALRIFHSFGGNLYTNHMHRDRVQRNALEYLRDFPTVNESYNDLDVVLEEMMENPLSLKEQCRLSLWKYGGKDYWKLIKVVQEVPKEIADFLSLDDL